MKTSLRSIVLHQVMALSGCLLLAAASHAAASNLVNHPAPAIAGIDLHGHRVSLSGERGKVVLLNFWATWCGPCRLEMPRFVQWEKQYAAQGFQVIGVSIDDSEAPVRAFAEKLHLNYPVMIGDADIGRTYGILGVPVTYLIDRNGVIRARFDGESDWPAMQNEIRRLLGDTARFTPAARSN